FQAEDGIRDRNVTGVQTCALPIFRLSTVGTRILNETTPSASTSRIGTHVRQWKLEQFLGPTKSRKPIGAKSQTRPRSSPRATVKIGRASCRERVEVLVVDGLWYRI